MYVVYNVCVVLCLYVTDIYGFMNVYGKIKQVPYSGDPGQPLILTDLIKAGKIEEARAAAQVHLNSSLNVESYAGYFTVNDQYNSNMFFWFFPSQTNYANAPVLLWVQGGLGVTSLIGLFAEHGPYVVKRKHGLKLRKYAWTQGHSVIYLDNPVGTGYSFTNGGYAKNQTAVGADGYAVLLQFFTLFPELQKNDVFLTGESYSGKYVPAVAYAIHKNNPSATLKINLQGLCIGNGLSDPEHQLQYGEYLYQIGLVDSNARKQIQDSESQIIKYIQDKAFQKAFDEVDKLLIGSQANYTSFIRTVTGFENLHNYLISNDPEFEVTLMGEYVQRTDVRKAIHVGNVTFYSGGVVAKNLEADMMQSVAPWISELLSHYRVLIYNGQLDIIVAYPLTVNYLQNLDFSGADQYKKAPRIVWRVGNDVAGYVKEAGNLTEVLVRNAGHRVPHDQPIWALDLITRFTSKKGFTST